MRTHRWPSLAAIVFILAFVSVAGVQAHIIIFKDGFMLSGQVQSPGKYTADPTSGQAVWITTGTYVLDAPARRIFFSPHQVPPEGVLDKDLYPEADVVRLESRISRYGGPIYPLTQILGATEWDSNWERKFKLNADFGRVHVDQRLGLLTPHFARVDAKKYNWSAYYLTSELGPVAVRNLLNTYPEQKSKSVKDDPVWRFRVYRFFVQAGWYEQAEQELAAISKDLPDEKEKVEAARENLRRLMAYQALTLLEQAHKAGRYHWVEENLSKFPRQGVDDETLTGVRALQAVYETAKDNLTRARRLLKDLPPKTSSAHRAMFTEAAAVILDELDHENVSRLDAFLSAAGPQGTDGKEEGDAVKSPDELMSLAVTGWLLHKDAADSKVDAARRVWRGRQFVFEYQKSDDATDREQLRQRYLEQKTDALEIGELSQLIGNLPPPQPEKDLAAKPLQLRTISAERRKKGIPYIVQLPPEYHHSRPYPVLFSLHQSGEQPEDALRRVRDTAAQHGYIVVAPHWDPSTTGYTYTPEEHRAVTEVLRDLRRRFQLDSDRVFLMGAGEGANMAFDVGLGHPDLFAGVLPMAGGPRYHATKCWPNSQNLPYYVVDGNYSGEQAKANQELFKKWVPLGYPSILVQYKGRGVEWFGGELPSMFEWMDHKRDQFKRARAYPELGRLGGSLSQEFQSMRSCDNRFYWLSIDAIHPSHVIDDGKWSVKVLAATLYGRIYQNSINITVRHCQQLSVWLRPDMIDFTKPLTVRINQSLRWNNRTIQPSVAVLLEDFYHQGDRQRLFWARLDFDRP
jgi:hypothetical protein